MCRSSTILFFILALLQSAVTYSKTQTSDVELHNLRWDWYVYNGATDQLVPFFELPETTTIQFEVSLNKYRNSYIKFDLQENSYCWIENQLVFRVTQNDPLYWSVDSLKEIYGRNKLSFVIYNSVLDEELMATTIIRRNQSNQVKEYLGPSLRLNQGQSDVFIVVSVVILLIIASFRTAHFRLFREYFSLSKALQQRQSFDLITAYSPMAWPNIGFIIFYAILVGCSVINIGIFHNQDLFDLPFGLSHQNSLATGMKIGLLGFVLMLMKLVLISASAALFKINKIRLVHFFAYFRHSLIISIGIFIFSLLNGIFEGSLVSNGWTLIESMIVVVWTGRVIQIFFVLNKIYTFRKLHLFSYLCSTELIPLLLFFKIFLK